MSKAERIKELEAIIAARLVSEANGATPRYDDNGKLIVDTMTCGTCGTSWNDALISERTPTPSGRCPYEYEHDAIAELRRLKRPEPEPSVCMAGNPTVEGQPCGDPDCVCARRLTEGQRAAYLKADGGHCPLCGSESISGGGVEIEGAIASQEVDCDECGATWTDTYTLTGVEVTVWPEVEA